MNLCSNEGGLEGSVKRVYEERKCIFKLLRNSKEWKEGRKQGRKDCDKTKSETFDQKH